MIPAPGSVVRHYKGGRYHVLTVADHHDHDGKRDVVYISLTNGKVFSRPLERDSREEDSWTDLVAWPDGVVRRRFIPDDTDSSTLDHLFKKETTCTTTTSADRT